MIAERDLSPSSNQFDPAAILAVAEMVGLAPPRDDELPAARELAATLMGQEVVSVATLRAVQAVQPTATLVYRNDEGRVIGVSGQLLLRPSSVRPLLEGAFDALDVDTEHLCRAGETPALGYCWGVAAATKPAAGAVIGFNKRARELLFDDLTIFTRAVTPVGRHTALNRHGYVPLRGPDDDLLIRLPERQAAAA